MNEPQEEPRTARSARKRGQSPARYLYGALLVAIGGCLGIVIGSVSDTPRILFERLRGPVETVDLEPAPAAPAPATAPPLQAFGELQGGPAAVATAKPKPAPAAKAPEPAKPEPAKTVAKAEPKPAAEPKRAPAVSSPPPAAAAAPAKTPDQIVRELEKKTAGAAAAPSPAAAASSGTVVQVLSLADQKQADAMIARLRAQGFEPYSSPMPNKAGKLRVRVRPKSGETTAALEARLRGLGFKTWTTSE